MFIEIVDALRCPVPHEESWLVAATGVMEGRYIVEGTLGCPVCKARYPIRRGVVDMRSSDGPELTTPAAADPDEAGRIAALLNLTDGQGFAVLLGAWGMHAPALAATCEVPLMLIDPPIGMYGARGISVIRTDGLVPVATGTARAMAIDGQGNPERITSAVRSTRAQGRIIAPVEIAVPTDVREIARDERLWVGERHAPASPLLALHVRRG